MAGERGKVEEEKNDYLGVWVKKNVRVFIISYTKTTLF